MCSAGRKPCAQPWAATLQPGEYQNHLRMARLYVDSLETNFRAITFAATDRGLLHTSILADEYSLLLHNVGTRTAGYLKVSPIMLGALPLNKCGMLARHVPRLEFRREECSTEQLLLDDVFETLALERERDTVLQAPAVVEDPTEVGDSPRADPITVVAL